MTSISVPSVLAQLVARSRKLGADRSICNWGGGNTSAKVEEVDFRGRPARVLWVKGSGSDLVSVTEASFTGLYLSTLVREAQLSPCQEAARRYRGITSVHVP